MNNPTLSVELLTERKRLERVLDLIDWRRRQLNWLVRRILEGRAKPRPVVILTTSRSGSTWLCEVLWRALRTGRIPEHLRPHHWQAVNRATAPEAYLDALMRATAAHLRRGQNGGTKIIWDDIPGIRALADSDAVIRWLQLLADTNPVWVRLVRRDRVAQALSRYRAASTGVFHDFKTNAGRRGSQSGNNAVARVQAGVPYQFEGIFAHYQHLQRAEHALDQLVLEMPWPVLRIDYETASQSPHLGLNRLIANASDLPEPDTAAITDMALAGVKLSMIRERDNDDFHRRFSAELAQRARD